ncbi:hypothetical protein RBB50_012029 [Rhinocladiella similis]
MTPENSFDVVIVGAGFSGLYLIHRLREAGFSVKVVDEGSDVGGTWYWNCYPGARVDTKVPAYQFTDTETWADWQWKEHFPDRNHIMEYFRHVGKVWDVYPSIQFDSRVTEASWDDVSCQWDISVLDKCSSTTSTLRAQYLVLCTGFASKPYIPAYPDMDKFKGECYHTARWPQSGVEWKGKRVGIIGTGASGVQATQAMHKDAAHLTVFQRTPNLALPMSNPTMDEAANSALLRDMPDLVTTIRTSHAGFVYNMVPEATMAVSDDDRLKTYEQLFNSGGLEFWLGNYSDMLLSEEANKLAYDFYHERTARRVKDARLAELLLPKKPPHPFGTKRVSLEQDYFEAFNQPHVQLVSLSGDKSIARFVPEGIQTTDGEIYELDLIVLATGFDSVSGGITSIDVKGTDGTIAQKWSRGIYTHLGLSVHGFPNMFFTYGPQAPTAFATGPATAELQGDWITTCLRHMRVHGLKKIETDEDAERKWREHVLDVGDQGLFPQAKSWYFGDNIPGKPREALNYMAGMPEYRKRLWNCATDGYSGYTLS